MNSRLGTPRKKLVRMAQRTERGLTWLMRPSMRSMPSTSEMTPAVRATWKVPTRPRPR